MCINTFRCVYIRCSEFGLGRSNTMMYVLVAIILSVGLSEAFLINQANWNDLKITWGLNPFGPYFISQPRTESEARDKGFNMISDCGANPHFAGRRYAKDNDESLILIYDSRGFIAGIQAGFAKGQPSGYPTPNLVNRPFVLFNNSYYITAYFVDPSTICKPGRTPAMFGNEGTGDKFYIQNGTDTSVKNLIDIPLNVSGMSTTMWTKGHCFPSMGLHYWYNLSKDMNCDDIFPVFLLYNDDKLNGFGWAFNTGLKSTHYEYPPKSVLGKFLKPVPDCLAHQGKLSTMHIYMTSTPRLDFC